MENRKTFNYSTKSLLLLLQCALDRVEGEEYLGKLYGTLNITFPIKRLSLSNLQHYPRNLYLFYS